MSSSSPFKIIIVGAGPVGLYMAHAMEKAGIDYIVLEQQPTVLNFSGQLVFTWPQTVRLFDQIGLYEKAKEVAMPIHYKKRVYGEDGHVTSTNSFWDYMEGNHGYKFLPLLRSDLVKILYENLKGRETNVRPASEVVDIESNPDGVLVHLGDGTTISGSIVVGADGCHSKTRKIMQRLATDDGSPIAEGMVSSFYGIFGRASIPDLPIEPEVFFESRGSGAVIQCLGTKERLQFVTLKPLPEPDAGRKRYSREDMEEYAASLADVAMCPGITFKDVWARAEKSSARMLNQEEGFMSHWYHKRVVLVGDAVHKSTSVNGLGMTCGLHSAAMLANELQTLLAPAGGEKGSAHSPTTEELQDVFVKYQKERQGEVKPVWDAGAAMIREVTDKSWGGWFWDTWILPWLDAESFLRGAIPSIFLIRHGQTLSYVPFTGKSGTVPWVRRPVAVS